jgi:hypothetical protein
MAANSQGIWSAATNAEHKPNIGQMLNKIAGDEFYW